MADSIQYTPEFWEERFGTPECVQNYYLDSYECLDDLGFMRPARQVFDGWCHAEKPLEEVALRWKEWGWDGDGEIQMIWFPPFAGFGPHDNFGAYVLHVKQCNDNISWLACPLPLPFHRLHRRDTAIYPKPSPDRRTYGPAGL